MSSPIQVCRLGNGGEIANPTFVESLCSLFRRRADDDDAGHHGDDDNKRQQAGEELGTREPHHGLGSRSSSLSSDK